MASGADTQTDRQTHTHTRIPTREPKQFQETRRARPKAARAWFKNNTITVNVFLVVDLRYEVYATYTSRKEQFPVSQHYQFENLEQLN